MAIQGGPDIVEDGLVLHLDAAEPLCFRGEPTTNLAPYTSGNATRRSWPYGAYTHSIETMGEFAGWEKIVATSVGSATSNYIMHMGQFFPTSGVQYTGSIEFYSPYNNLSFEITGGQGIGSVTRIGSSNKYYRTFATSISTNMAWYLRTIASTPANTAITNGVIYYRRAQFEQKPYYTDFTIGTRGSAVATGGGLLDLTNNGNNGTINRAAAPSAAFYNGDNKGSLVFNGVNDVVNCGNILNFNYTDVFTLSAWIKRSSTGAGVQNIICKQSMSSPFQGYQFGFNVNTGGSQGYLGVNTIGHYPSHAMGIQTQTTYNDTNWHYVVATYNGNGSYTGLKLYVEAELKTSSYHYTGTSSVSFSNSKDLQIAARDGVNQLFSGSIPQVFIHNKELSASEILQNYNATKGRFGL